MAERLGSAVLELRTDDAKFTKGVKGAKTAAGKLDKNLKKAEKSSGKLGRALAKVGTRVKGLARGLVSMRSAVVLAAGAVGFGLLVKKALNTADAIGKAADAIGISTDALQEYRHAAELSGVATGQLDKALMKATRNIGELGRSSSELDLTLKELAPDLLANVRAASSVEEALELAFVAMSKMATQTKRAAVANAFFGRSGILMTNIVRNGADAYREMIREARTLGLIIPEVLIRNAEEANDQLTRLTKVMGTQATIMLTTLSPAIIDLGNWFLKFTPVIQAFMEEFLIARGFLEGVSFEGLQRELARLKEDFADLARLDLLQFLSPEEILEKELAMAALEMRIAGIVAESKKIDIQGKLPDVIFVPPDPRELERAARIRKRFLILEQRARRVIGETRTAQEELNQTIAELGELLSERIIDWETYSRALEMAQDTFDETLETGIITDSSA